ncbi:hypothetical protein N8I77_012590 [Diaporthe amygdali]|uniref:Glycoside hydrolase 131 catalytic N-terminal domain-containing protein n=1 Tax=Phomopsis amygdali TaxID=1214568 RepID=A0AAD9S4C4_PHOAM|nr:hypothetical protein N8I77_012590 [Diaporthe amygdali]
MKTTAIIYAFLAMTANAGPVSRRQAAGGNLQTFTGNVGGATAPAVTNVGGDRPFRVDGVADTFKAAAGALDRSCSIQKNACATAANSGTAASIAVSDCDAQQQECSQAAKTAAAAASQDAQAGQAGQSGQAAAGAADNKNNGGAAAKAGKGQQGGQNNNAGDNQNNATASAGDNSKGNQGQNADQGNAAAGGAAAGAATGAAAAGAVVLPDGRIKQDAVPEDFNVLASPFKSAVVKGDGLNFSDIITFPNIQPSIFDAAGNTKAFEISINDKSVFVPQGQAPQDQFRRADLLPSIASTLNNVSTTGKKTMHFSLQQDAAKPLALTTNEYQVAFLETADFASRIFDVRVGTGTTSPSLTGGNIVVLGRSGDAIQEMFVAPFSADLQNFAVTLDFDQNTMQVFHSTGQTPLAQVSEAVANDNSGNGEYHFALLKLADAQGQQAANIDEGLAFAGIFMEDSADGTVTLQ